MNNQKNHVHFLVGLVALSLVFVLAGCGVGVPSKASVNVRRIDDVGVNEGVMVSLGPRRFLDMLSKKIVSENEKIEVVDGLLFRDTAFPDGDWSLDRLLEPEVCSRVGGTLNVDYLILVGSAESKSGKEEGFLIPLAVGAMSVEGSTKISAAIIDMKMGSLITQIESVASGTAHLRHYVIFVVANEPQTASGAIDGLAKEIGDVLVGIKQSERVRIAVMAIEESVLPLAGMVQEDSVPLPPPDVEAVREKLRRSAEDGDPASQWRLYADYGYLEQDWVWLCEAADQEYGDAMVEVGNILWEGRDGIVRDRELARCWYKAAVDAGYGDAKSELMAAEWMLSGDRAASTDDRCTSVLLPSCEGTLLSRETP